MKRNIFLIFILLLSLGTVIFFSDKQSNNLSENPARKSAKITPVPEGQEPFVIGWTSYWDDENSLFGLNKVIEKINAFSPILYHITPGGDLELLPFTYTDLILDMAKTNKLPITPVIGDDFDSKRVNALLYNSDVQNEFINRLVEEARKNNYDGWEIDIETLESKDKKAFTSFVKQVYEAMQKNDLTLRMILYAKDENETYDPTLAQDYAEIAKNSDEIILMTYGYNNDSTLPGAQAPLEWYRSVLDYSLSQIPQEKIIVGLTTHGYDWSKRKSEALTYPEVLQRITEFDARVEHDLSSSSKIATYTNNNFEHVIWYEDADTMWEKVEIAQKEFGINKFAVWRIGAEDEQFWERIH